MALKPTCNAHTQYCTLRYVRKIVWFLITDFIINFHQGVKCPCALKIFFTNQSISLLRSTEIKLLGLPTHELLMVSFSDLLVSVVKSLRLLRASTTALNLVFFLITLPNLIKLDRDGLYMNFYQSCSKTNLVLCRSLVAMAIKKGENMCFSSNLNDYSFDIWHVPLCSWLLQGLSELCPYVIKRIILWDYIYMFIYI